MARDRGPGRDARQPGRQRWPASRRTTSPSPAIRGMQQHAVVRASATGAVLATITAPRPYRTLTWVSGAADDRTFVLAAQRWWRITRGKGGLAAEQRDSDTRVRFFRLRLGPSGRVAQLTTLPLPEKPQAAQLAGIALSPDGSKLAIALHGSGPANAQRDPKIGVISLATGSMRMDLARYRMGRQLQAAGRATVLDGRRADARVPEMDGKQRRGAPPRHHRTGRRPAVGQAGRKILQPGRSVHHQPGQHDHHAGRHQGSGAAGEKHTASRRDGAARSPNSRRAPARPCASWIHGDSRDSGRRRGRTSCGPVPRAAR